MLRTVLAICLAASGAALAGHLAVSAGTDATGAAATAQSFITPRIDGRRLDVRLSAGGPANPATTAERFCRAQGFDTVVGYSVQPASATRTISDHEPQDGQYGMLRAFYAIRCAAAGDRTTVALM